MRAYLVSPPRDKLNLKQCVFAFDAYYAIFCDDFLCVSGAGLFLKNTDRVLLAVLYQVPAERVLFLLRHAVHKAEIKLADFSFLDSLVHRAKRGGVFRRKNNAAGVSVNTVAECGRKRIFLFPVIFTLPP